MQESCTVCGAMTSCSELEQRLLMNQEWPLGENRVLLPGWWQLRLRIATLQDMTT